MSIRSDRPQFDKWPVLFRQEWFMSVSAASSIALLCAGRSIMGHLANYAWLSFVLLWLFIAALGSILSVVRHADHLAIRLGEPYGTLLLTLVVTSVEVVSISAIMLHGENNPTLARDTIFAVVMIILNGMVGLSLLIGGWRHHEQQLNLQGANAYLGVIIPLAMLSLALPTYTVSTAGPTLSFAQETFLAVMSVGLYGTFLIIQTRHHQGYFRFGEEKQPHDLSERSSHSLRTHITLLAIYMLLVVFLAEQLALPVDHLIEVVHAPAALGGIIVAALVATPEAIGAVQAAWANHLQRSVNIFLGSVLATIGLTVPAMLVISNVTGKKLTLGLQNADLLLLPLSLALSIVTFSSGRTNILQGAVHLLLFAAYLMLVFQG